MVSETFFSLLNIGFNISFMLYLVFKYFYERHNKYYLFLALLSLSFVINVILRLEVVDGDYTLVRISRKLVVLFFYVFMLSFLDLSKSRFVKISLLSGMAFIGAGILSRGLMSYYPVFADVNSLYKSLYTFVDLYLIGVMIFYISRNRKGYYRYIFYGLLAVIICAILIYYGDSLFGLNRYISEYLIFQIEIVLCFCFFFLAIITKENEQKKENKRLERLVLTQELEKEKSLYKERERIAFDMHDELGAGISAIKLQTEILKQQFPNGLYPEDIDNLIKISENMNRSMREMLWSINPGNDSLKNFIDYCIGYGETYFEKTNIHFRHEYTLQDYECRLNAEVRYNLLLMLKEAFHNCVKHSQATVVLLKISEADRRLSIVIDDNGIGFLEPKTEGYGLKSMRNRVEKLHGDIVFHCSDDGTCIHINVNC